MNQRGFLGALSAALVGAAVGVGMPLRRVRAEPEASTHTDGGFSEHVFESPERVGEVVLPVELAGSTLRWLTPCRAPRKVTALRVTVSLPPRFSRRSVRSSRHRREHVKTRAEGGSRGKVTRPAIFSEKAKRRSVMIEPANLRWLEAKAKAGGTGVTVGTVIGGLVEAARRAKR